MVQQRSGCFSKPASLRERIERVCNQYQDAFPLYSTPRNKDTVEDALTNLLEYSRLKSTHSSDQRRRGANTTGEHEARRRPDDLEEKNTMSGKWLERVV